MKNVIQILRHLSKKEILLISSAVGLIIGFGLLISAYVIAPNVDDIKITSERTGVFIYHYGAVRSSANSTLGGVEVLCVLSVAQASSTGCSLAKTGQVIRVEFVKLDNLFGRYDVAVRASNGDQVIYESSPKELRSVWFDASFYDALFYGFMVGFFFYAVLTASNQLKGEK
nr:hypothetical protein [uncultured Albidiferax sp.]